MTRRTTTTGSVPGSSSAAANTWKMPWWISRKTAWAASLTIKAPNARVPNVNGDASLEDRINYVLYNEINPGLAAHGGMVTLVEVVEENVAVLQFGGGCQGCSAVDITLKHGVETALLEQIPDLAGIKDATDHTVTENAYYR